VLLDSLPLTESGKLDQKSLPAPSTLRPQLLVPHVAPENDVERIIANIWQEVLGIEGIGIYDNFFEVGGHSLLLVQIHARLSEVFPHQLTVVNLFEYPTIDSLATFLTSAE